MSSRRRGKLPQISDFSAEQVNPALLTLLEICHHLHEEIQALRDEIARLKGQKARPKIKPSKLEDGKEKQQKEKQDRRGRRGKRSKTSQLEIHDVVIIPAVEVTPDSRCAAKGRAEKVHVAGSIQGALPCRGMAKVIHFPRAPLGRLFLPPF